MTEPAEPAVADPVKDTKATMGAITLSRVPTLRALYQSNVLRAAKEPLYPYRADLLDRVSLFQGDITRLEVDAIVNAANRHLLGGGGVDGAIHAAAGHGLLEECETLGAATGEVKITKGYRLPAKHVLHAVGPVYSVSRINEVGPLLSSCYRKSLELGIQNSLKTIAFCSISTGIYGYPIREATRIALEATRQFLHIEGADTLERVIFVVWSDKDKGVYEELIPEYFVAPEEEDKPVPEETISTTAAEESESNPKEPTRVEEQAKE